MEKVSTINFKISVLVISFLLLIGGSYSSVAKANASSSALAGEQLAYYIGYHSAPGYVYPSPPYYHHHQRKLYWSGWRYVGHGCRKNCLIDRWSGRVIRCNRVCH